MFDAQYTYFIILAPAAAVASILIGIQVWSQKDSPGAKAFVLFMVAVTGWIVCYVLELLSLTNEFTFFWSRAGYIFITAAPILLFFFSVQFFGKEKWLRPSLVMPLFTIPIITNLLLWRPNYIYQIWQDFYFEQIGKRYLIMQITAYGDWFWVSTMYNYILIAISILLILLFVFRSSALYRQQAVWILLGAVFPILFNLIYIFNLIPVLEQDFTPISFAISGIMVAMGIYRYKLFDLSPIAREVIIDQIDDGFIIIDRLDRIIDMNFAANYIFQVNTNEILGHPIQTLLKDWDTFSQRDSLKNLDYTIVLKKNGRDNHYEVKISELRNKRQQDLGTIILLRDVTERVRLLEEVQQLAIRDSLTDVFNRRHFFHLAERVLAQSIRYHRPLSILMLDIDHFKNVNDQYGHAAGDLILQVFSKICMRTIRTSDIFARFGGEEFIILLPETNERNAQAAAERLRKEIAEEKFPWQSKHIQITASIGVACLKPGAPPVDLDVLIDKADQALYQAKQKGRNQVITAKTPV